MPDLSNITVNGVSLEKVIDEETREEIKTHHQEEVRSMSYVKKLHTVSRRWNNSGARSGKVRIIFSRAMAMGGVLCQ